jgi:hypothetical protein
MEDITVKELEIQIRRAAKCASATLPAEQLTPLLDLALRAAGIHDSQIIKRMQEVGEAEITLSGDEVRLILDLALRAKLSEKKPRRPRLKAVPPSPKKK